MSKAGREGWLVSRDRITQVLARLRRDHPQWHFTHHATATSPDGVFLARRPVPLDDSPDVLATAASEEQELRRRVNIQETIAQRLLTHGRTPVVSDSSSIAGVIADLERSHPHWHITCEISSLGATFTARRPLSREHIDLGLLEIVEAPNQSELDWRLATQDAQIAAVSMATGPNGEAAGCLTNTVAGFENLLRRAAGEL